MMKKLSPLVCCGLLNVCSLNGSILNAPITTESGFIAAVEYLYWKGDPRVVSVAQSKITPVIHTKFFDSELQQAHFNWSSGVKAALGYKLCDNWTVVADYTYFQTDLHKKYIGNIVYNGPPGFDVEPGINLLPLFEQVLYPETHFNANWSYNQFDLLFDRAFRVGPKVALAPFGGIKYLCINQKLLTHSLGSSPSLMGTFVDNEVHQHYNGLGVAAGLKSAWNLFSCLSFVAESSFSLLYAWHHLVWKEANDFGLPIFDCKARLSEMNYTLDSGLAFVISETCFGGKVDIKLGWEWHYISDITKVPSPLSNGTYPITEITSKPLTLQGLVVGVNFLI